MADEPENTTDEAIGNALPRELYDQLRSIAHLRMSRERVGHTLQTTALVHEALMRMTHGGQIAPAQRPQFFRNAAETMRRLLIDHARAHRRDKRGGGLRLVSLSDVDVADGSRNSIDLVALDEAICRLEGQAPDAASVVRLRFFGGLTVDEIAETLGIAPRSVDRLWVYARARLWQALRDETHSANAEQLP